ncbi:C1q-like domain-containing protein [Cytobacillus oceanisediminis]|uniref:C1q-like domain-containing protein n=1 Tax=Cytobacillus oceanisediminis TaxID=665099 RepID=UPI001FB3727B|nr:hypothetical protein [Cytobacillus oceanisediminis]UOE58036.1 hypothetical protein IRB79_27620 [Cytobacillus oceanisediminis]
MDKNKSLLFEKAAIKLIDCLFCKKPPPAPPKDCCDQVVTSGFLAYASGEQEVENGEQKVLFPDESINLGLGYDRLASTFTIPVDRSGLYNIAVTIDFTAIESFGCEAFQIMIKVDGSTVNSIIPFPYCTNNGEEYSATTSINIYLTEGEQVEIFINSPGGRVNNSDEKKSSFSMARFPSPPHLL